MTFLIDENNLGIFELGSNGKVYAKIDGEFVEIKSKKFRNFIRLELSQKGTVIPKKSKVTDIIEYIESLVSENKIAKKTYSRFANPGNGKIYLGLGAGRKIIEITSKSWDIVNQNSDLNSDLIFLYNANHLKIPEPTKGGNLTAFKNLLNVTDVAFYQIIIFIMAVLRAHGPYPILNIIGPQGSSKSTTSFMIRQLIDPMSCPFNRIARTQRDLEVIAHNNNLLVLNNCAKINDLFSVSLCRIATEGGASYRTLFETDGETHLNINKPVLINSITQVSDKPDFIDRSLCVHLPKITGENRRFEEDIKAEFEKLRPEILGVFLDGVSSALANYQHIKLKEIPRMADVLRWAVAAAPGLGLNPDDVEEAFWDGQNEMIIDGVESSPSANAIFNFMQHIESENKNNWQGTASQLLAAIADHVGNFGDLPKTPNALSRDLQIIEPLLNARGIELDKKRSSNERILKLFFTKDIKRSSPASNTNDELNISVA